MFGEVCFEIYRGEAEFLGWDYFYIGKRSWEFGEACKRDNIKTVLKS